MRLHAGGGAGHFARLLQVNPAYHAATMTGSSGLLRADAALQHYLCPFCRHHRMPPIPPVMLSPVLGHLTDEPAAAKYGKQNLVPPRPIRPGLSRYA